MKDLLYPLEILLDKKKKNVTVKFNNNKKFSVSAELLRVESPSADVQGHGGPKIIVKNKQDIKIQDIEMVGNYAIRIVFSDGHNSGIYTWEKLFEFGQNGKEILSNYYDSLQKD